MIEGTEDIRGPEDEIFPSKQADILSYFYGGLLKPFNVDVRRYRETNSAPIADNILYLSETGWGNKEKYWENLFTLKTSSILLDNLSRSGVEGPRVGNFNNFQTTFVDKYKNLYTNVFKQKIQELKESSGAISSCFCQKDNKSTHNHQACLDDLGLLEKMKFEDFVKDIKNLKEEYDSIQEYLNISREVRDKLEERIETGKNLQTIELKKLFENIKALSDVFLGLSQGDIFVEITNIFKSLKKEGIDILDQTTALQKVRDCLRNNALVEFLWKDIALFSLSVCIAVFNPQNIKEIGIITFTREMISGADDLVDLGSSIYLKNCDRTNESTADMVLKGVDVLSRFVVSGVILATTESIAEALTPASLGDDTKDAAKVLLSLVIVTGGLAVVKGMGRIIQGLRWCCSKKTDVVASYLPE